MEVLKVRSPRCGDAADRGLQPTSVAAFPPFPHPQARTGGFGRCTRLLFVRWKLDRVVEKWRPVGVSNPCFRRERPAS
jgi:hypothetical protein